MLLIHALHFFRKISYPIELVTFYSTITLFWSLYMNEYKYIERLKGAMEGEYSQEYINICIECSTNLLD